MKYYSQSTHGFYDLNIHKNIPKDCVEISDEEHCELIYEQSAGKVIEMQGGRPIALEPSAQQKALIEKSQRQQTCLRLLQGAVIDQMEITLEMYQTGLNKGLWAKEDFPTRLVDKMAQIHQALIDFRNEEE